MDKEQNTSLKKKSKKLNTKQKFLDVALNDTLNEAPSSVSEFTDSVELSKLDKANIEQLLMQIARDYKEEELSLKKEKVKDADTLNYIIKEFLSCFILIGFTVNNEKVCLFNAATSKDESALVDYLRATFFNIVNNRA